VDKRTFGLTNEYSIEASADGQLSAEEVLGRAVSLRNGGRLHLVAVRQPEYATPDCGSVPELVVHDKAGERILEGLLADAIRVFKTNAGGSPFGCRENYTIARRGDFGRLADILIPFLVTRQLICGAGAVAQPPRGAVYCLSRPAVTTRSRPFINTRDEPRDAAAGLRRLRVIASDSTMSETTTLLKAGATDLVLRMAEAGIRLPDRTLDNPVQAIGEVSRDITGRRQVRLTHGREMSALDIQRDYLARARDFTDNRGADAVTVRVLGLWERALDAIGTGDLGAIAREIDWAIKYQLIDQYRAAHDLPLSAPQVARADLDYHDIDRRRGLYYQLVRGDKVDRTARDIDIFEAKTVPPDPGRYRRAG
jgi:proteasome accessory factor A